MTSIVISRQRKLLAYILKLGRHPVSRGPHVRRARSSRGCCGGRYSIHFRCWRTLPRSDDNHRPPLSLDVTFRDTATCGSTRCSICILLGIGVSSNVAGSITMLFACCRSKQHHPPDLISCSCMRAWSYRHLGYTPQIHSTIWYCFVQQLARPLHINGRKSEVNEEHARNVDPMGAHCCKVDARLEEARGIVSPVLTK